MAPVVRNTGVFLFAESYGILCEKRGADAVKDGGENKNLALGIALGLIFGIVIDSIGVGLALGVTAGLLLPGKK